MGTSIKRLVNVYFLSLFGLLLVTCGTKLPSTRYPIFDWKADKKIEGDSLVINIPNPLNCPLRVTLNPGESLGDLIPAEDRELVLSPLQHVRLTYAWPEGDTSIDIPLSFSGSLGDPRLAQPDTSFRYAFPIARGSKSRIIQGYFGSYSHYEGVSKYALDFGMAIGDTIYAARGGWVVSKVDQYTVGGPKPKFRPFGNLVFIYHEDGSIAQYYHLAPHSVPVEIGDEVKMGQPIGRVGMTGYTDIPHLHFCVMVPDSVDKARGVPIKFEKAAADTLKRNMWVSH
ncbi:MAG: M23 family metallopeptidase [Bacteroidota bacterium]